MASSRAIVGFQISESVARRAQREPVALERNGGGDFVLMSARAYQKFVKQAEEEDEDRYWVNVLNNMTPEEKKPIGVKETQKLFAQMRKRIAKKIG